MDLMVKHFFTLVFLMYVCICFSLSICEFGIPSHKDDLLIYKCVFRHMLALEEA